MQPALLIRLRPSGPWRYGHGDGGEDRVDTVFRSDRLFSAITLAMKQLDWLDEWLQATARAPRPAVTVSSLFPYQRDVLFVPPPATLWPPPAALVTTPSLVFLSKLRWKAARFVPLTVIESLVTGQALLAEQWIPDPESGCLLRRDRPTVSPFRVAVRRSAAIDRLAESTVHPHSAACVEFEPGSGMWCVARFVDSSAESPWAERVKACFRLLADSGFGGKRSSGWGKAEAPEFQAGSWPDLVFPKLSRFASNGNQGGNGEPSLYWLLSLYSPGPADAIDWTGGDYRVNIRAGRIESTVQSGRQKKSARMIIEGSVVAAREEPIGTAIDVAPDNFAHPVYRSGFAVALELPVNGASDRQLVEIPPDEEALEARPCDQPEAPATADQTEPPNPETPSPETAEPAEAAAESEPPSDAL